MGLAPRYSSGWLVGGPATHAGSGKGVPWFPPPLDSCSASCELQRATPHPASGEIADMAAPISLKAIKPYLERANELQSKDPVVAYHCRLYALQEAMRIRATLPKEDMGFVMGLMDTLEKQKSELGELDNPSVLVENFAQELFQRADDADRAGQNDLRTGKAFLNASQLIEVCKQFEELPADLAEKAKYAKWRFVEIAKAT